MAYTIREVQTPYTISPDDEAIGRETIILQRNGKPVAAIVPYEEYEGFQKIKRSLDYAAFQKGYDDYLRLHSSLLRTHRGLWVALLDGKVADSDPNQWALAERVYRKFGYRPVYMTQVLDQPVRIVEMGGPTVDR
jgi:hypothetical protein